MTEELTRTGVVATTTEELLRRLTLQDETVIHAVLAMRLEHTAAPRLNQRVQALVRLGALIAIDAPAVSYQSVVMSALAAGAATDDIVGALIAVAPLVGLTRVAAAAPELALAMGYDVDAALERLDTQPGIHA